MRLVVASLAVDRGERRVLDGLSLAVAAGEALVVTGRNGAGKSTLIRAVAGLTAVAGGSITLEDWEGPRAAAIHLVGHLDAVKPQLTVAANLAFWSRWHGGALTSEGADETVERALEAVGLLPLLDSPAAFLSQGQRRRLALARLVAAPRPLWLLDEPTAGLDRASRDAFAALMGRHIAEGGLILAATHEPLGLDGAATLALV
jgi:heme exporter protein A